MIQITLVRHEACLHAQWYKQKCKIASSQLMDYFYEKDLCAYRRRMKSPW